MLSKLTNESESLHINSYLVCEKAYDVLEERIILPAKIAR